jgi:hypothetical protein
MGQSETAKALTSLLKSGKVSAKGGKTMSRTFKLKLNGQTELSCCLLVFAVEGTLISDRRTDFGYGLLPGVGDFLTQAKQLKIPVGILTKASLVAIKPKIEAVAGLIDQSWTGLETSPDNPWPECFLPIFRRHLDLRPNELVFISAQLSDWQTVCDTQIKFIAAQTGAYNRAEFEGAGVPRDMIIKDMKDLVVIRS